MAYTTIDKPTDYFNTKTYSGQSGNLTISGIGFQPDWVWIKGRNFAGNNVVTDSVRGVTKELITNIADAEVTTAEGLQAFQSDGFQLGDDHGDYNRVGRTYVSWSWKAGGSAPAITYSVKVVSDSGNKYRFDDFGTSAVTLDLQEGGTYTFDQSDSSNSGHPLRFSTTSNGTHGGGSEYTTGVTTTGTPGSAGAKTVITVAASAPTLYYYCTQHSGMGGQANTNSTFGSSNFSGSIQSRVSAESTQGFSIVSYTGTGSVSTIGHGLGAEPKMIIIKSRAGVADHWWVYHKSNGNTGSQFLNLTNAFSTGANDWNNTTPTSSVFTLGIQSGVNSNGATYIAYCFAEKKGYSKFGSFTGNGNADGTFVYTGFKPAFFLCKDTDNSNDWVMFDNKRDSHNVVAEYLRPNLNNAASSSTNYMDFTSNGIKHRVNDTWNNGSGRNYIYMAFAESPFVTSSGIPTCAR